MQKETIFIDHLRLPSLTIPKNVAWVKHFSWLNSDKSKRKTEYQIKHFNITNCSYLWDYSTNQLVFNKDYYAARQIPYPEVIEEKPEVWMV